MNYKIILVASILAIAAFGCDKQEVMTEQAPPKEQKVVMVPSQHGASPSTETPAQTPPPSGSKPNEDTKQPGDR